MEAELEAWNEEDIHICGKCRLEFHSLNSFVRHKSTCTGRQRTGKNPVAIVDTPSAAATSSANDISAATVTVTSTSTAVAFSVASSLTVTSETVDAAAAAASAANEDAAARMARVDCPALPL